MVQEQPKSKTRALFDAVSTTYDIGTYEQFEGAMANPEKRVKIYNALSQAFTLPKFDKWDKTHADDLRQSGVQTVSAYDEKEITPAVDQPGMSEQQMADFLQPIPVNEPETAVDQPGPLDAKSLGMAQAKTSTTGVAPNPQQPQEEVNLDNLEYDTPGALKFAFDAINRGILQGEQSNILNVGDEKLSDAQVENLASISKRLQDGSLPRSPAYEKFINSKGLGESLKALTESPQAAGNIIAELTLESLAALITHGSMRAGTGAVTGGTMGSIAPGIGTAAGAALGAVSGLGLSSLNLEYTGSILGSLQEAGVDITDADSLKKGFEDDEVMSDAKALALKRGVPIAVWDMMSAGVAGRITSQPAKSIIKKAGQIGAEMGLQAGMGMAGEGHAQATTGEPVNWSAILAEGIGEIGGGAPEVVAGTMARNQQTTTNNGKEQEVQASEPSAGRAGDVSGKPDTGRGEKTEGLDDGGRSKPSIVKDDGDTKKVSDSGGVTEELPLDDDPKPVPKTKAKAPKKKTGEQPTAEKPVESQEDSETAADSEVQQQGAEGRDRDLNGDGKERVDVAAEVVKEDVKPDQKADIPQTPIKEPAAEQAGGEADTAGGGETAADTQAKVTEALKPFDSVNEQVYPETANPPGGREIQAKKGDFRLSVKPAGKGKYQVFLGEPGKDAGGVDTFGQIESWDATEESLPEVINRANAKINELSLQKETTPETKVTLEPESKPEEKQTHVAERKRVNFELFGEKRSGTLTDTITDKDGNPVQYKVTDSNGIKRVVSAVEPAAGRKVYSEPIGAGKAKGTDRIQPSPIFGQPTKKLSDITLDLRKASKSPIFFTKSPSGRRRSLGSYNPRSAAVAIKYTNDLDTLAHEIGHSMDDKYGVLSKMEGDIPAMEKELTALSKYGSKPPKGHPDPKMYRLGEGVAEYFRGYVVNPGEARQRAPEFTRWAERAIPKETWAMIDNFSNDVRAFAGGTAHESIMSNVQMDPTKAKGTLMEKLKPSSTSKDNFEITTWDRLAKAWVNDLRPFEKAIDFLQAEKGIDKLNPSEDPRILARVFAGVTERMDNMFREGLADIDNQRVKDEVTGDNITMNWLFEPLDNSTEQSIHDEMQETLSYMIAERTNELGDRFGKDVLTGIGGGLFKDKAIAQKRLAEHEAMPDDKKGRIEEAARRYRVFSDTVLRYMVDAGRMSETAYNTIRENNLQYVALNRVLEAAPGEEIQVFQKGGGKAIGSASNVINKIKGSTRTIKNPYSSLLDFTYRAYKESDRNRVMQAFHDLFNIERGMYQGDPAALGQVARKASEGDKNTVKVFIDGKPEYWQLQEDVYASVKRITDQATRLPGWLIAMARLTRWTVTNFPVFALRNRIRDFQQRMTISNTGTASGYDIYFDKKLKQEVKDSFQLFGGGQGGHYLMNEDFYYTQMEIAIRDMAERKDTIIADAGKIMTKFGDGYKRIMSSSETGTRLEEYRSAFKKAKREGMDDYNASVYAAFQARDLMDFSIAGEYVRAINQVIPFTNAAVQGISKTVRSAKANPVGFAIRWAIYAAVPALANRLIVHAMDKDDEYEELPAYQRDLFYNLPMGDNLWLSIPKPFEIGVLASGAERLMSKMMGYEESFEGYAASVARSTMPVDDAALVGPARGLVEVISNYDFFRQKNIIPPEEDKKALELRRTGTASRLGQTLQKIVGVDARNIDHIIKAQSTYFGDLALRLSDAGRDDTRYPMDLTTTGLFKNTPVYNSKSVQWVMQKAQLYGLTQDPIYQQMSLLITDYFNAPTDEEKEKRGRVIKKFAKDIKEVWTDLGIEEEVIENPQDFKLKSIRELMKKAPRKDINEAARRGVSAK